MAVVLVNGCGCMIIQHATVDSTWESEFFTTKSIDDIHFDLLRGCIEAAAQYYKILSCAEAAGQLPVAPYNNSINY
jgi:hypothetical protein